MHRGKLQGVLYAATRARIGEDHIHTAHQLYDFAQDEHGVTATFIRRDGAEKTVTARGDVLIAADGIHSTVRRTFYPDEGVPTWNGIMLWRGAMEYSPFSDRALDAHCRRDAGQAGTLSHLEPDEHSRHHTPELGGGCQARRWLRAATPA
ncbi:MAG: FAD-dependent monooxygenase [Candidatus Entotheonellia bacterium]